MIRRRSSLGSSLGSSLADHELSMSEGDERAACRPCRYGGSRIYQYDTWIRVPQLTHPRSVSHPGPGPA